MIIRFFNGVNWFASMDLDNFFSQTNLRLVYTALNCGNLCMSMGMIYLSVLIFSGCGIYSFTGTSISPEVKTISISTFPNNAPIIASTLSQEFSENLKDKFITQTNLNLVEDEGDLLISGNIVGYGTMPINIKGDETAAQERLTITVKVKFVNKSDKSQNFDKNFSRYADFDSNQNLTEIEAELIKEINELLIQDIFNETVANW